MAFRRYLHNLHVYMILMHLICTDASKLNVPRILLPIFNEFSVNFTLEATESGCYKWITTRMDVVYLTPVDEDSVLHCSSKVIVSTITREQAKNIAVVLAEDIHTSQILRCDVIVDSINSLTITTTAKELFMEEAPEAFEVRAYDDQGNEFTTLEGVVFDWNLACTGPNKKLTVLRFMRFKDSPYETPLSIAKLEDENKKGHIVLLEGVKTGSAKVTVSLPYEEYKHVKSYEVNLSVVANLIILPGEVYMMMGDVIKFKIIYMNNGKMEEVVLPDSQYYLDVEDTTIGTANQNTGEITALKEGKTKVVLRDRNVAEDDPGLKLPSALLNVVIPAYMQLNILPHRNWNILVLDSHDIVAELFSGNDHKLHVGPGVEIQTQVGDEFNVQQRSLNGSWLSGWAVKEGTALVEGSLISVLHPQLGRYPFNPPLVAQNELFIYPRITLEPPEVILPWDPVVKPKYDIEIKASGGDGKFLWSSSNHSVGVVSQSGHVKTHSHGVFEVSAAMLKNHHNRQSAKFTIVPPTRLEITEYIMEAEVGSLMVLHIALYAKETGCQSKTEKNIPFSFCQELPFRVKSSDAKFVENRTTGVKPIGISCANIAVVGLQPGSSKITVSYLQNGKTLEDSVTVSAFKPLQLLYPRHNEVVLAVGTSIRLVFTGGPRPSLGRSAEHNRALETGDSSVISVEDVTGLNSQPGESDFTIINVLCRKLGESDVKLSVMNNPRSPHGISKGAHINVKVICGKPRSVSLEPKIDMTNKQSCPMELNTNGIVTQSNQDIELNVIVRDDVGRKFLNISSLKFKWTLTPPELGVLGNLDGTFARTTTKGSILFANESYQVVTPKVKKGTIEIRATLAGYHMSVLNNFKINPEWPEFVSEDEKGTPLGPITTAINMYLVDDTVVSPNSTSLYNYPGNTKILSVTQGSGYYELVLSSNNIAEVNYLEGSREIAVLPLKDGELIIHVVDLCLTSQPAIVVVTVVSVSTLRVEMSDKVEMGRCVSCILRLYDENDNLMAIPDQDMLNVKVSIEHDIVHVEKLQENADSPWPIGEIHYVVTGIELGDTKLTFSVGNNDRVVESTPIELQVFPPLRVYPRNGTLLVGATVQFTSKGGPQPDSDIEYTVGTATVANVKAQGLVQGLSIGHTKVQAKAVGFNPSTGQKILYSQDTVDLQIIPISGIKIYAPLSRFQLGSTVPVWASGIPEQLSPLVLGSVEPPIQFRWSVENSEIVQIRGLFCDQGIEYKADDQVVARLTGLIAGRTRLHLNITVPASLTENGKKPVVFSTSIEVEVFEKLVLVKPKDIFSSLLLMTPYSSMQLETNMHHVAKIEYRLSGDSLATTDKKQSKEKSLSIPNPIITVSESGLLQSYGTFGQTQIVILATDEYGLKQTLSVAVEVKPIHYMMLSVMSSWHVQSNEAVTAVPLGTEFTLHATYYDNVGNVFSAGSNKLRLRTSRFDLISVKQGVDNNTLIVSIKKPGYTVMKVWADGIQKTADYVKLSVKQLVEPVVDYVTSGDILCLWTPVVSKSAQTSKWNSSDRSVVVVDQNTGIARVINAREGVVSLSHALHPAASVQLSIVPVSKIVVSPVPGKILTNTIENDAYRVPLLFLSSTCKNKTSNLINKWQCKENLMRSPISYPFKCHLEFTKDVPVHAEQVFNVKSNFDFALGSYCCEILPGPEVGPHISTLNTNVTIWATVEGSDVTADRVEIPFVPSVFVEEEINLDGTLKADLRIHGLDSVLDHVSVEALDEHLIHVGTAERKDPNVLKHQIQLIDWHWKLNELDDPLSILVTSKLTNQAVKVHIRAHGIADKFDSQCFAGHRSIIATFLYTYKQTLALILSMIVIFIITFYAYSKYIQPVINVNVNPNRSLLSASGISDQYFQGNMANQTCSAMSNPYTTYIQSIRPSPNRSICLNNSDPVYGDVRHFYSTSPELRRHRRFI